MSLDRKTKASLQELLRVDRAHGEEPPRGWTKIELRQRLLEIEPSLGEKSPAGTHKTELQEWVSRINKARTKKAALIELCTKDLELTLTGNETIPTLERLALQRAHLVSRPMAEDVVGFGRHAALEYQDINRYQQSYSEWVLRTAAEESGCDYRLRRLAQWLKENPVEKTEKEAEVKPRAMAKKKERPEPSAASGSSSTTPQVMDRDMLQILQNLTSTMQDLKSEVAELKGERPRKKDPARASSEATSEGYMKLDPK